MTPTRRTALGALAGAVLAAPALAQTSNITGSYRAEGRNPNGSTYSGTAVIGQQGNAVQISWAVGSQSYTGSGVINGQVVVINWGQPDPVVYVVMSNGDLHGTWARGTALERLIRQ
ncbi:MAG: hypothetical protein AAF744_05870 [Pseudomonadota bacterium]